MKFRVVFSLFLLFSQFVFAENEGILIGDTLISVQLEEALKNVVPGSIVVVGESHAFAEHQTQQVQIMKSLRAKGLKVAVGMEFFSFPQQDLVQHYREGLFSEQDFLSQIQWKGYPFQLYREQALFPDLREGALTVALNAPRSLTGQVSQKGLAALSPDELNLLPPQFSLGRDSYKKRFLDLMVSHLPDAEAGDRYFAAQSIWDDTMAWVATEYIHTHPDQVMVIVVGDFHVQYGGGLPDRIHARSSKIPVLTFSQIRVDGMAADELQKEIEPSVIYGRRANYIWLSSGLKSRPTIRN